MSNDLHIIFGTGPVGLTLADELLRRGRKVRVVSRSGKAPVPDSVDKRAADAGDPEAVAALCQGAAVIYNCLNASSYAAQQRELPIQQQAMIAGAERSGATLVATDTLYMYGETHGRPMTEQTPHAATTDKGRMRAELAARYLQAHREGRIRVALGRAADFYGPRVLMSSLGSYAFPPALAGKAAQVFGNVDLPHSYSYMPDVARALADLGEPGNAAVALGRDWLLPVARPALTTCDMLRLAEPAVGHPIKTVSIPKIALQALGLFNPDMRDAAKMYYQYTEPQIVDSSQFEQAFGWSAAPPAEAVPATVQWFRDQQARS